MFTPENARRTLYVIITSICFTACYFVAILLYTLIYFHFIPDNTVSVPLYFDYSWLSADPYYLSAHTAFDSHATIHSNVGLESNDGLNDIISVQPGPFAAIDLSETFLPVMKSTINYKLSVDLNLPRNLHNQDLGNFMVRLAVTPNIHEFVRIHHHNSLQFTGRSGLSVGTGTHDSPKQKFLNRAGLKSRFPLTHFSEAYIMDLPELYIKGPAHLHANPQHDCKCEDGKCGCRECAKNKAVGGKSNVEAKNEEGSCNCSKVHAAAGKQKVVEKISVLATRPAILSYRPILLDYLEMLFWSPFYALGFFKSGFSEKISIDMVENWTKKAAMMGTNIHSSPHLTLDPFSNFVESVASSSQMFWAGTKSAIAKFRKSDLLNAEIPNKEKLEEVNERFENKKKKSETEEEAYENIFELNENLLASSDGHVWAVIELDRTAHLNDAKITLHTQWQGLRYYMHKFRLLLFIIGPFFIWGFEVFSLTLAAYLVISIFGSSSDSGNNNNKSDSTSSIGNRLPLRDATPSTHSSQRQKRPTTSTRTGTTSKSSSGSTLQKKKFPESGSAPAGGLAPSVSIVASDKGKVAPKAQSSPIEEKRVEEGNYPLQSTSTVSTITLATESAPTASIQDDSKNTHATTEFLPLNAGINDKESGSPVDADDTDTESIMEESMRDLLTTQGVVPPSVTHTTVTGTGSSGSVSELSGSSSVSSLRHSSSFRRKGSSGVTSPTPVTPSTPRTDRQPSLSSARQDVSTNSTATSPSALPFQSGSTASAETSLIVGRESDESFVEGSHTTVQAEALKHSRLRDDHTDSSIVLDSGNNSNTSVTAEEGDSLQGQTAVASANIEGEKDHKD